MKNNSITKSYLSISSPGTYLKIPSASATGAARNLTRQVNDYASALKAKYPKQFGWFASLPLPDIKGSLDEIDHVYSLKTKPDGFVLMSNAYGQYFGDPSLDPVWQKLNDYKAIVFEHPTTPCTENNAAFTNTQVWNPPNVNITPHDWQIINRPIATRQFATPTLDFPFESARTFFDLFISHIPSRFPNLKFIVPHDGGGLLPTMNRIVTYSSLWPGVNLTVANMKDTLAKQFWFDLAGPWPVELAIPTLEQWVDYTKILWASDTPWTPFAAGAGLATAFDTGIKLAGLSQKGIDAVATGNAKALFGN